MKRIFVVASLCMLATLSFAQKKAVKDAKAAKETKEARQIISDALTNPETINDPEAWKVAGDIEFKVFDDQRTLEMQKEVTGKGGNEQTMYEGLYNMYLPYVKSDSLGQFPDEKGKIKNKYRKDIAAKLKDAHRFYINGGIFYNDKGDYAKASEFFQKYWELPTLKVFEDDKNWFNSSDTVYQTIKYYAVISSIQSKDHPRSIALLNKLKAEPYVKNSTFKESDIYELLSAEYQQLGDSVSFVEVLGEGAKKFPSNKYLMTSLINEYIKGGKTQDALNYLDQAISNDKNNSCDLYSVKGLLFAEKKDYAKSSDAYSAALSADDNCERALEGLGVLYILQAQDIKEKASQTSNRKEQSDLDKQTSDLYLKALPLIEKYRDVLKARNADSLDLKQALMKLQNVYYNLSLLNIDKAKELDQIDKDLQSLQ